MSRFGAGHANDRNCLEQCHAGRDETLQQLVWHISTTRQATRGLRAATRQNSQLRTAGVVGAGYGQSGDLLDPARVRARPSPLTRRRRAQVGVSGPRIEGGRGGDVVFVVVVVVVVVAAPAPAAPSAFTPAARRAHCWWSTSRRFIPALFRLLCGEP